MSAEKQVRYWLKTAANDLETAEIIFNAGKNYHHCLFFCQLVREKGLKALVAKHTRKVPPRIHNLLLLAEQAEVPVSDDEMDFFVRMNSFEYRRTISG